MSKNESTKRKTISQLTRQNSLEGIGTFIFRCDSIFKSNPWLSTVAKVAILWTEGQGQFVLACNIFVWNSTEKLLLPLKPIFWGLLMELVQKIFFDRIMPYFTPSFGGNSNFLHLALIYSKFYFLSIFFAPAQMIVHGITLKMRYWGGL